MTTATFPSRMTSARPWTLNAAIILTVFIAAVSVAELPLMNDVPTVALVLTFPYAAVSFLAAWGMWNGRKWAAIVAFALTAINGLLSIPGIFEGPSTAVKVSCAIGVPLMAATCLFLAMKQTRAALH